MSGFNKWRVLLPTRSNTCNKVPRSNMPEDVFRSIDTHNNDPTVCWEWTGATGGRDGRGYMNLDGRKQMAHRIVYEIFNGPIKEGLVIRHTCDNPRCCNPFHLELGNRRENELDKYRRDRMGLPTDLVREIHRYAKLKNEAGLQLTDQAIADILAKKYDIKVARSTVQRIRTGGRRAVNNDDS